MAQPLQRAPDDDSIIDAHIGVLLRVGMYTSAAVVLVGGILLVAREGRHVPDYRTFHGAPTGLNSIGGTLTQAFHGDPLAIIQFGLLLLIATPVARVIFSVFSFLAERDYLYVIISTIVLLTLLYSIIYH